MIYKSLSRKFPEFMSFSSVLKSSPRAGSGKSVKSLDSGHKLRLDLTKGCFIVKRERTVFSHVFDLGKENTLSVS